MDIRDVARLSGYSLGTVSRVLNDNPGVSDRARERVLQVVRDVGYEPNTNARHLKMRGRSSSYAIIVKGMQNMLFTDIIEKAEGLFAQADEEVRVHFVDEDADEAARAAHLDKVRHPKGFLFLGGTPRHFIEGLSEISVPCVLLTNTASDWGLDTLSSFTTDDAAAAESVIDYLWEAGHRRIGVIGGNWVSEVSARRLEGVERAFRARGVTFDRKRSYEPCRFSMDEGYQATMRLLARSGDLTAIFALGDVIALGALRAISDQGYRVPADISLVGFDGLDVSQYCVPRLSTVRQDTGLLARRGVEALMAAVEGRGTPAHEFVPFRLLRRESVLALRT